jgi:hypothetical protein
MKIHKQGEMFKEVCEMSPKIATDRSSSLNMLRCTNSAIFLRHTMRLNKRRLYNENSSKIFSFYGFSRYQPAAAHPRNRSESVRNGTTWHEVLLRNESSPDKMYSSIIHSFLQQWLYSPFLGPDFFTFVIVFFMGVKLGL